MSDSDRTCPACGNEIPATAPRGLCPACLLKRGLEPNTLGPTQPPAADWTPPTVAELTQRFPELEILRLIGRGGMGAVYQARQKNLDRTVALKILPPEMGHDPAFAERFAHEAQAMAKLNHPHIVTIHEFGKVAAASSPLSADSIPSGGDAAATLYFFLMEYVDGMSLRGLLDTGHISPKEALAIVPQICEALQYAHDHGIVHRDIKPENILLNKQGQVKIADFGLAKLMGQSPTPISPLKSELSNLQSPIPNPRSPISHSILGTPQYMAPEQMERPAEVDHRADIYSLGVVFYQMLTGELPRGNIQPPSKKVQIDVRLDEVVLRAMEKEPERRYQQASEVKTEVETIVERGVHARGRGKPETPAEAMTDLEPNKPISSSAPAGVDAALYPHSASRLSRTAIVGATLFLIPLLSCGYHFLVTVVSPGMKPWEMSVLMFWDSALVVAAIAAIAATTILGWIAVTQIRHSAGRLYGLGLGVFDGLLFPLLALDGLISVILNALTGDASQGPFLALGIVVCLIFDARIAWWVWRTVNKPITGSSAPPSAAPIPPAPPTAFGWEYRSKRTLWGLPLFHIAMGIDPATGQGRAARGVVAVGQTARGIVAMGGRAVGVIAFGGFAAGLLAFGGFTAGLLSFGGFAFALLYAYGGLAIGPVAFGGLTLGYYCFGGYAMGVHALGGNANDPSAREFFALLRPNWLTALFFVLFGGMMCLYGTLILLGRRWSKAFHRDGGKAPADRATPLTGSSQRYWFRAKGYGWGWGLPASWEGWLFFLVWLLNTGIGTCWLGMGGQIHFAYLFLTLMVMVLLAVCFAKGEPPRWRWGEEPSTFPTADPAIRQRDKRLAITLAIFVGLAGLGAVLLGSLGDRLTRAHRGLNGTLSPSSSIPATARKDNIDLPFVNDPVVVGTWKSVDFVNDPTQFDPDTQRWQGDLYLKEITFLENGKTSQPWSTWTKGFLIHHGDQTASRYEIREISGQPYLFLEWKSGNVTIRGMKPQYYVLRKAILTTTQAAPLTQPSSNQMVIEDAARQLLAAIASSDDQTLKNLASDRIRGWREALPLFAKEMRQQFQRMAGKPFDMRVTESRIEGDWAAVRCDGPAELKACLVLFFVKTPDGWRNHSLRNAPLGTSLEKQLQTLLTSPAVQLPGKTIAFVDQLASGNYEAATRT